ncbi:unnamed protein product [Ectocarpus sp. 13 AM-2016]
MSLSAVAENDQVILLPRDHGLRYLPSDVKAPCTQENNKRLSTKRVTAINQKNLIISRHRGDPPPPFSPCRKTHTPSYSTSCYTDASQHSSVLPKLRCYPVPTKTQPTLADFPRYVYIPNMLQLQLQL